VPDGVLMPPLKARDVLTGAGGGESGDSGDEGEGACHCVRACLLADAHTSHTGLRRR